MTHLAPEVQAKSMRIAWVTSALLFGLALPHPTHGQTVQGQLLESGTSSPVEGALVLLLDEAGTEQDGYLTNDAGRFQLKAPQPGRYTIRAERIGFGTVTSETIRLSPGQVFRIQLQMSFAPILMEELRVEGDRRCVVRPEEGMALASLWEEARKALVVQEWTAREEIYPFQILRYTRNLDVSGMKVESETREQLKTVMAQTAIRSRPAANLMTEGFVQPLGEEGDRFEYFGPDASVLLSDEFLATHCLRLAYGGDPAPGLGISFEPVRTGGVPDIKGTLWLDPETTYLKFLEYEYTWAPLDEARGLAKGRVDFENLPNGAWIVRNWWIRTPILEVDWAGRSGQRSQVLGYIEEGEEITRITSPEEGDVPGPRGTLEGTVWDSTGQAPLANAEVYLSGTQHAAITDSSGRYQMADVREGVFTAAFTHPRLDSLGVYPPGVEVSITAGEIAQANLVLPPMGSLLEALCRDVEREESTPAVVGTVLDAGTGNPQPGATVSLVWIDYRVEGSGDISGDRMSIETTTNAQGRYRACGISPGALVTVQAAYSESKGSPEEVVVPFGTITRVDLTLGRKASADPSAQVAPPAITCSQGQSYPGQGAVSGRILETNTEVPVGNLKVWLISDETGKSEFVQADGGGRFLFCPVESGGYSLRAVVRGFGEAETGVEVHANQTTSQDLSIVFQDPSRRTGELRGRVVAAEDGRPLSGARVSIQETEEVRVSGEDGSFTFSTVPAGTVTVTASSLGYADSEGGVLVGGGQTIDIEVRLSPQPIEMEPIVVEATRLEINVMLADVRRRAESGWGTVLMGEEFEFRLRTATRTTDILHEHGANVVNNGRTLTFRRTLCAPAVYLDGIRIFKGSGSKLGGGGGDEAARAVNLVHPMDIEAMEIYRGPAQTPGEFLDSNAQCGVILIWTKRGGGFD